jgi:Kdo2-lipid IVA lauroyltransferase/acyltransferase
MSKYFTADYLSRILFRALGLAIGTLPRDFSLFIGRRLGGILYYFDLRHKAVAYANIKTAFGNKLPPHKLSNLTYRFYRSFGQNILEIFFIPFIDKEYMNKYITFEGMEFIDEAFKKGKGVVFLGMHSGSWELSNVICANLGFAFSLFVRDQKNPLLNELLRMCRRQESCKIIERQGQIRQLIEALKNNEAIGMTVDQGGKSGRLVEFFGKDASMATGAVRLSLKYDTVILPAFYTRVKGPYIKTIIQPPVRIKKTQDAQKDIHDNLQEITRIFEKNIERYPSEYLWSYKVWKYAKEKHILVLNDGKAGHLRQGEALAKITSECLKENHSKAYIETVEVKFRSVFAKRVLMFSSCLSGKYQCQGCLWCLKAFLERDNYESLISKKFDIIISCGSAISSVNYVLSRENLAKSIMILRSPILGTRRFDLVIMPRHDNPAARKNIVATEGALNLIDQQYLKEQTEKLLTTYNLRLTTGDFHIGLLIGGDTKEFRLKKDAILGIIRQVKIACEKFNTDLLVTTSRRTSKEVEGAVKEEFLDYPRCKMLVVANEKNTPEAVGGILGLASLVIVSPESISMISEAVNSKKYVLVFGSVGLGRKHSKFLEYFARKKYIYLVENPLDLSKRIEDIWLNKPQIYTTNDSLLISQAIRKIL